MWLLEEVARPLSNQEDAVDGDGTNAVAGFAVGTRSLQQEIVVDSLPVEGQIPSWLNGSLYRNGPALFEVPGRSLNHWFDGFAMIHRFHFRPDRAVAYRNRFVRSDSYTRSKKAGRLFDMQFGTNPGESWAGNVAAFWKNGLSVTDNTSVSLVPGPPGELVALTEAKHQQRIDANTLETLGRVEYRDRLGYVLGSAHPHYDYQRKETVSYAVNFARKSSYLVHRQPAGSSSRELIAKIPVQRPCYMHSFALTRQFAILVDTPITVNPLAFLFSGKPFIENYRWDPHRGTRFLVVDRHTGAVQCYEAEPMFVFHTVNAWEHGKEIFVDLSAYPDAAVIDHLQLDKMRTPAGHGKLGLLRRYRLTPGQPTAHGETISPDGLDLPNIHYRAHNAQPYRYAYGISNASERSGWDRLLKVDTSSGQQKVWREDGCFPAEPIFVPRPGDRLEDQGVVFSAVLDARRSRSFLLVLDAESFSELARAQVPHAIPFGFHGLYVGD